MGSVRPWSYGRAAVLAGAKVVIVMCALGSMSAPGESGEVAFGLSIYGDGPDSAVQTNWLNERHDGFLACYTLSLLVKIVKTLGFLVYEMYLQSLCTEAG